MVHEVSHIANVSVDFSYTHSEKALAAEHQGSVFHQLFNGLVQLATSGQPDILKFNSKNYRIFEIALMDKILSGQCTAQELSSIFEQSNKIMALIRREGQRVGDNNKLIRQEDLHYASLATAYGYLDELNTAVKGSQADDLQGGKKFIVSLQQFIENWRNLESCDQEKIRALRTQLPLITSALVMNNADSAAVGIGVLSSLQGYYATLPPQAESASSQSPIERVEAGLLSLAGLTPGKARMEGDQQLDAAQPSDLIPAAIVIPISSADDELSRQPPSDISSENSLVKSLKAEIEMLEQMNDRYKKRVEDLEKTQDQQDRDYLERLGELKKINDQQHQDHLKILSELASQYNQFEQSMLSKYNEFRGAIEENSSIATGSRGLSPGTPDSEANTGRSVTGAAIKNLSQEMVAIDSDPTVGEGRMTPTVSTSSSRAASPIVPQL